MRNDAIQFAECPTEKLVIQIVSDIILCMDQKRMILKKENYLRGWYPTVRGMDGLAEVLLRDDTAEKTKLKPEIRDIRDIKDFKTFDPDRLKTNEITNGKNGTLAKIPTDADRIARKTVKSDTVIQFIHDRVYDPEKKQVRIRRTTIGISLDPLLRGMMLIKERTYRRYFDREGRMIYKPSDRTPEEESNDPEVLALEEITYEPAEQAESDGETKDMEKEKDSSCSAPDGKAFRKKKGRTEDDEFVSLMTELVREGGFRFGGTDAPFVFDASKLEKNEIPFKDTFLVRIPAIPGRISRRARKENRTVSVELVTERHYDPATRQTRRKRISIGLDAERVFFPGMMFPNKNYYQYFDHDGNWIVPESETDPEMQEALKKWQAERETQKHSAPAKQTETERGTNSTAMETTEAEKTEKAADGDEKAAMEQETEKRIRLQEHFDFLSDLFEDYISSVTEQARKRPQQTMTIYQVRKYNELLNELKNYFIGTDLERYLTLAELPKETDETENSMSSFTYGDMDILLGSYYHAIRILKNGRPY